MAIGLGILLLVVALGAAIVALWLTIPLRRRADQLTDDVSSLRHALEELRGNLEDLQAAAQVVPVPPLPKTRTGGLDDLRQRLRAAHEADDSPEE